MEITNYYDWQTEVGNLVPENMKIDNDLLVLENVSVGGSKGIPRKVDASTFIIVDKGSASAVINGRECAVNAPCLAVVLPDQTYQVLSASEDLSFRALVMSKRFTGSLFGHYPQSDYLYNMIEENPVMDLGYDLPSFDIYYKTLIRSVRGPVKAFRYEAAKHLTLSMLYHYTRRLQEVSVEKKKKEIVFEKFCSDVKDYFRINRELPFYSGRLGVSSRYLTELVKDKVGKTAADYIDWHTIIECKALLTSTEMSVQQISRHMNFPSPSVFGKFFKRIAGVSPTEYRDSSRS